MSAMSYTGAAAACGLVEGGQHLLGAPLGHPGGQVGVDLVAVRHATREVGEALVVTQADQVHHPGRHRLRARRHRHPPAVAGPVGVAGHRVGDPGAQALLDLAERARRAAPADPSPAASTRSGSRRRPGRPPSAPPPSWRRPRPAPRSRRSGRSGGSRGWPSGSPLMAANPDRASAWVAKPALSRYGPVWPKPDTRVTTRRGLRAGAAPRGQAEALQRAGPEVLHQHVGASRTAAASRPGRRGP